ncbi:trypsin-like serine protease [Frankia sp. AgB1.9]|uniref:S1 family peptidase n=1 Tax=unclassified Frankia TaxID=2632575 RepID=UPI00193248C2|nr:MULTISPECIES: trypsin-like serine protease [unclassified Frankia]MBL7487976.1 trypsin-like serine protease [Frankia sp. AgW1.1]MBL7554034.1 trypsin-like serine protease [Frankia sp. AgB1.9]MBL7620890.1 trypsin-like serine protease [Frankia sp. AgB1.8]
MKTLAIPPPYTRTSPGDDRAGVGRGIRPVHTRSPSDPCGEMLRYPHTAQSTTGDDVRYSFSSLRGRGFGGGLAHRRRTFRFLAVASTIVLLGIGLTAGSAQAIVGGTPVPGGYAGDAVPASNPYAFVGHLTTDDGLCTASLIAPDLALTASHCVPERSKLADMLVVFGVLNKDRDRGGERRTVIDTYTHNDAEFGSSGEQMTVLKLNRPVRGITPVRLATPDQSDLWKAGSKLTAVGWGAIDNGGHVISAELRRATVKVTDTAVSTPGLRGLMATVASEGHSAPGDSGGPLLTGDPDAGFVQVGVAEATGKFLLQGPRYYYNRVWLASELTTVLRYPTTAPPEPGEPGNVLQAAGFEEGGDSWRWFRMLDRANNNYVYCRPDAGYHSDCFLEFNRNGADQASVQQDVNLPIAAGGKPIAAAKVRCPPNQGQCPVTIAIWGDPGSAGQETRSHDCVLDSDNGWYDVRLDGEPGFERPHAVIRWELYARGGPYTNVDVDGTALADGSQSAAGTNDFSSCTPTADAEPLTP